jgi:hypothetical protein
MNKTPDARNSDQDQSEYNLEVEISERKDNDVERNNDDREISAVHYIADPRSHIIHHLEANMVYVTNHVDSNRLPQPSADYQACEFKRWKPREGPGRNPSRTLFVTVHLDSPSKSKIKFILSRPLHKLRFADKSGRESCVSSPRTGRHQARSGSAQASTVPCHRRQPEGTIRQRTTIPDKAAQIGGRWRGELHMASNDPRTVPGALIPVIIELQGMKMSRIQRSKKKKTNTTTARQSEFHDLLQGR